MIPNAHNEQVRHQIVIPPHIEGTIYTSMNVSVSFEKMNLLVPGIFPVFFFKLAIWGLSDLCSEHLARQYLVVPNVPFPADRSLPLKKPDVLFTLKGTHWSQLQNYQIFTLRLKSHLLWKVVKWEPVLGFLPPPRPPIAKVMIHSVRF